MRRLYLKHKSDSRRIYVGYARLEESRKSDSHGRPMWTAAT